MANEWSVERDRDGYANSYELDMTDLRVLNLCDEEYTILHWLAILVDNRTFEIQTDFGAEAISYLKENYLLNYNDYDVIIGYRADARSGYSELRNEPWRRGEVYMMTIIDEEMKADDVRLRPDFT